MKLTDLFENSKRNIYLDLDGVFADFPKAAIELHGSNYKELDAKTFWAPISFKIDNFFSKLDVIPGSLKLHEEVKKYSNEANISILTALPIPRAKLKSVKEDKTNWVHKHIDPTLEVNTVIGGKNKGKFCKSRLDILIDDTKRNIDVWEAAGGIGIFHTGDYDATISEFLSAMKQS